MAQPLTPYDYIPVLAECLSDGDARVRMYAAMGLRAVGTKEARTFLWQAGISAA